MNPISYDNRRHTVYIDHIMQKWLLAAMVILECTLTAGAIGGLYWVLTGIIDDHMYRIHFSPDDDMLAEFAVEGAKILAGTGVVNLIAILLADRIWAAYVQSIVGGINRVTFAAQRLDLRAQSGVRRTHAVLDRLLRWQRAEGLRLRRIRHSLRHLPERLPDAVEDRAAALAHLRLIQARGAHPAGE